MGKGEMTSKAHWGYSESAVKSYLWVAISSYFILVTKVAVKSPLTITDVSNDIEELNLYKSVIQESMYVPEPLTQNQNVNELLSNF